MNMNNFNWLENVLRMLFKKTGYFLLYIGEYYKWFLLKVCNFEELDITYQGNFNIYST